MYIKWFKDIRLSDLPLVGGKNASLGEMYSLLSKKGIRVPNGFAITAEGYRFFLQSNNLAGQIEAVLQTVNTAHIKNLTARGKKIRELILNTEFPKKLEMEIWNAYGELGNKNEMLDVAVRSSATAEDLPTASFAGQQDTFLNIQGKHELIEAVRKCFASLFTDRAISYRATKGFCSIDVALSVGIQKMVRSDLAASGVMFTIDTETGFQNVILINAAYGLGEYLVGGMVNPDEYYIFKPTLRGANRPIVGKRLGSKERKLIYSVGDTTSTQDAPVSLEDQKKFALSDDEILSLARWGLIIEEYYSQQAGEHRPMDIEWAKDGQNGKLYILQARPETVHSNGSAHVIEEFVLEKQSRVLAQGAAVGNKIGQGKAHVIKDIEHLADLKEGEVLVAEMTDPDWEPVLRKASAIVTNSGGRTCHAAIISRELGIPCVVGTKDATTKLQKGAKITVSCAEGEQGKIYEGILPFKIKKTHLDKIPEHKTKVMVNIADPEIAFTYGRLPHDGVGLARMEFIINTTIKIHPLLLLELDMPPVKRSVSITPALENHIRTITHGYATYREYYIHKLSLGISRIAAAFHPMPVIVRFSDFKSNEYHNLIGGPLFEPHESNPMLGWRGAARYYDPSFLPAFQMECAAIKRVREVMGLENVQVMIPFCRTPEEGKKVLDLLAQNELYGKKYLKRSKKLAKGKTKNIPSPRKVSLIDVYVMCEIPSNVILANEFADIFDGFSIGSNDLTQLTLGVDRDSDLVRHIYDERNDAVKSMIVQVIKTARKKKTKVGICGQAPSDFPDFAEFLVHAGIDSISLNPDTMLATKINIAKIEKKHAQSRKT